MNVVDSSGWLEYLADGPNADFFEAPITAIDDLVVPAVSVYEVFKRVLQQRGEPAAVQAVALMLQGRVVPFDADLAMASAHTALREGLALADSAILTTARRHGAVLWTQDADFEGRADVRYRRRSP